MSVLRDLCRIARASAPCRMPTRLKNRDISARLPANHAPKQNVETRMSNQ